jgi:molecular chaperone GrpE
MEENKNQEPAQAGDELEKLKKERDEYLAGWQRAKADFINHKKDEMRRLEEMARYGNEDLVRELITVLDNFDLALRIMEKEGQVEKGIYLIRAQMEDILKRRGVERIEVKPGDTFDPSTSESMAEVESELPGGTVVEEIEAGYRLYDKILRPARVKISKHKI